MFDCSSLVTNSLSLVLTQRYKQKRTFSFMRVVLVEYPTMNILFIVLYFSAVCCEDHQTYEFSPLPMLSQTETGKLTRRLDICSVCVCRMHFSGYQFSSPGFLILAMASPYSGHPYPPGISVLHGNLYPPWECRRVWDLRIRDVGGVSWILDRDFPSRGVSLALDRDLPSSRRTPQILAGLGEVVDPSAVLAGPAMGGAAWRQDPMSDSVVTKAILSSLVSTNPPTDPFHCSGFHEASFDPHRQLAAPAASSCSPSPLERNQVFLPPMGLAPPSVSSRRSRIPPTFPAEKICTGVVIVECIWFGRTGSWKGSCARGLEK